MPFAFGALLTAVPVPNRLACVGSIEGAIHTLNCGGRELMLSGVRASRPPTAAGDRVTVAVAFAPSETLGVIVSRAPIPFVLLLLPPLQLWLASQTSKVYLPTVNVPLA